jgi:regulator of protease activity HflC (stomatin/prohibitin superfamily)
MNNYFKASGTNRPAIVLAILVVAGATLSTWLAYDSGTRSGYWIAGGLAILGFLIPQSLMVANQWERAVVLRLGKLTAIRGPGMFAIVPFIDNVASWLDQRIQTTEINAEKALSKDTVPVNIDAVVFWQIHDPERAALEITNYRQAITQVAQTSLREIVGSSLLSTLLSERKQGDQQLREDIGRKTAEWGVSVLSVEIRDIGVPPALQDAMSRQAQAEREKLARVLLGQAEQEIAQKFVEAADIYARSPAALQLRAMNIIYETTKERGATILIPTAMVDSMNPAGAVGLVAGAGSLRNSLTGPGDRRDDGER